jgi:predicted ATPase/signal transduction histidine kinase
MQALIPGYRLTEELHRSNRSLVYRGLREADGLSVVLKTINKDYPEPQDIIRLRREYRLLSELDLPGVVRVLGLEPWENNLALVMEDCRATPLESQLVPHAPMGLEAFFPLALAVTRTLGALHQHLIHKDINPRNLLWHPETHALRFVDFGLAAAVGAERDDRQPQRQLVGSLPYMSPEQTGRMNRDVDGRTDFYSLGVTFYRLLAGQLPFTATDPMEWAYCHITQIPAPPHHWNPQVPAGLSAVVLKLLAKDPDDRYQSAHGLWRDLQRCEASWRESGDVAPFPLATDDITAQFRVPGRLYGRRAEAEAILDAFHDASSGRLGLVVVTGEAGIGKSALVGEVSRAIGDQGGRFAEGKFDQFQRHVPYAAVAQALTGLVRQVLAEPEERLQRWRAMLSEALGPNGRIAVDLVPELARIIGQPAPLASLAPTEEQNRFLATIQSLVTVFAPVEQPLVLFLDDLQWSDAPTLLLLRRLVDSTSDRALLIIGAYRDDEVQDGHPLLLAMADTERTRHIQRLRLEALDAETLNLVVAGALHADPEATRALADVVHAKTAGNPFFAAEMLRTLHQDGLFQFDHAGGRWCWDVEAVLRANVSANVVSFMLSRVQRLPADTQARLRLAACIGDSFEPGLVATLVGQPRAVVTAAIAPAVAAGLVAELPGECPDAETRFHFVHDRVRQAAYALNDEAERQATHVQIGRAMLSATPADAREERAAAIAQQLNEGRAGITDPAERLDLARLNLAAGRRAQASAAYRSGYGHALVAKELLPEDAWAACYDLTVAIFKLYASCAYLSGEHEAAHVAYAELLRHTRTTLERAEVYAMRAAQYTFASRMDEAIAEGLHALTMLGIRIAPKPGMGDVLKALVATKLALGRRKATDLDDAPLATDRRVRLAMTILEGFLVPAYLSGNDTLFAVAMLKQASLSLRHGNCDESVSAYGGYAVLLAGMGDLKGAYDFGQLALRLMDRFGVVESKCRAINLYALFSHSWSQPWSQLESWFKSSVEAGLQNGDFLMMAYACGYVHLWDPQIDLKTAVDEGRRYIALCRQTTYGNALDAAVMAQQFWLNLRDEIDGPLSLSDAGFDEAACYQGMVEAGYVSGQAIYHLFKLQLGCFHGAWDAAWASLTAADRHIRALAGSPYMVQHCVYGFQAAVRRAARGGPEGRAALRRARGFRKQMAKWAGHCPANFEHHARLMDAELAALQGRASQAPRLFESAVASARQSGFVRDEARANEAAAHFYQATGLERVAMAYWRDARDGYGRWGATGKVRAIDALLPAVPVPVAEWSALDTAHLHHFNLGLVPQLVESGQLDLSTVWKATQAISGEPTFERLLDKLLAILKESAGAQAGMLVLAEGEDGVRSFRVQASSTADGETRLMQGEALEQHTGLPVSLIRYVIRSQTSVVLNQAATEGAFTRDPYIQAHQPHSVLAMPIVNQGALLGVLYLENRLVSEAFTPERLTVLQMLAGQAAVSLQTLRAAERAAYLEAERVIKDSYARELETRVDERTAELMSAYQQLMELDRLKTNFLSVVSHELRTPLTTIRGYAEFLEDGMGGGLGPEQLEFVKQIQLGTVQLRRLVDDLLDFARVEAGAFKLISVPTDLTRTVTETLESLAPQLHAHGLTLESELPTGPVWAHADAGRISQVILNLVGNAVKFTPRGGRLCVVMRETPDGLRVEVRDSGIGIAPEHVPKLFQKFYQVDSSTTREAGGVGLGLSIAQSIIEAHGGQIGLESTPGEGSTFYFTLPREPQGAPIRPENAPTEA